MLRKQMPERNTLKGVRKSMNRASLEIITHACAKFISKFSSCGSQKTPFLNPCWQRKKKPFLSMCCAISDATMWSCAGVRVSPLVYVVRSTACIPAGERRCLYAFQLSRWQRCICRLSTLPAVLQWSPGSTLFFVRELRRLQGKGRHFGTLASNILKFRPGNVS